MKHKILREFDSYADQKITIDTVDTVDTVDTPVMPHDGLETLPGSNAQGVNEGHQEVYKTTCFKQLTVQTWSILEQNTMVRRKMRRIIV
jgi:hypothetical protein